MRRRKTAEPDASACGLDLPELHKLCGDYCMNIAMNILGSQKDAEEVVNDAMLAGWQSLSKFMPNNVMTFFGRLTRNAAINRRTRLMAQKRGGGKSTSELTEELAALLPHVEGPEEVLLRKELMLAINDYIAGLPAKKRKLFVLRYWYCEPVKALAERFGVTENKINVDLHRIRNGLKKYLKERELME